LDADSAYRSSNTPQVAFNRTFELLSNAAALAIEDSGLPSACRVSTRGGIVVAIGGLSECMVGSDCELRSCKPTHPLDRLRQLPNIGAALVAIQHRLEGPSVTLIGDATAGVQAILQASELVRNGVVDYALCGAADARLTVDHVAEMAKRQQMSPATSASNACRPFDIAGQGIIASEGAVLMLLECGETASRRGARIYAGIKGSAVGRKECSGWSTAMCDAAALFSDNVDGIIAHGDGTPASDAEEANTIDE